MGSGEAIRRLKPAANHRWPLPGPVEHASAEWIPALRQAQGKLFAGMTGASIHPDSRRYQIDPGSLLPFILYPLPFTTYYSLFTIHFFLNSSIILANLSKRYAESCGPGEASG